MNRVSEIDDERRRNYINNLKKHEQNMKLYDMHNQLAHSNEEYRKHVERFTDTQEDILHHIWRN